MVVANARLVCYNQYPYWSSYFIVFFWASCLK
jgi:hypothetical protein